MEAIPGQSVQQQRLVSATTTIAARLPAAAVTERGCVGSVEPSEAPGAAEAGAGQPEEACEQPSTSGRTAGWRGRALSDQTRGRGLGALPGLDGNSRDDYPNDQQYIKEAARGRRRETRPVDQAERKQRLVGRTREATQAQARDGQTYQPAQGKRSRVKGKRPGQRRGRHQGWLFYLKYNLLFMVKCTFWINMRLYV